MSSAWDRANQRADEVQSGMYLRLKSDGDRFVGIFVGEPEFEDTYFNPKTDRTETYTETHKAAGLQASPVFKYNVYVLAETNEKGQLVEHPPKDRACKIFSMKAPTFKDLRVYKEKYGSLEKKIFEVRRSGAKNSTNTRYTIVPEDRVLTEELLKEALGAKRHDLSTTSASDAQADLNTYGKGGAAAQSEFVDPETLKTEIIPRLKAIPHEKMVRWLQAFQLQQVKSLPKAKLEEAKRLLDELEGKTANAAPPPAPPPPVIDPFAMT